MRNWLKRVYSVSYGNNWVTMIEGVWNQPKLTRKPYKQHLYGLPFAAVLFPQCLCNTTNHWYHCGLVTLILQLKYASYNYCMFWYRNYNDISGKCLIFQTVPKIYCNISDTLICTRIASILLGATDVLIYRLLAAPLTSSTHSEIYPTLQRKLSIHCVKGK